MCVCSVHREAQIMHTQARSHQTLAHSMFWMSNGKVSSLHWRRYNKHLHRIANYLIAANAIYMRARDRVKVFSRKADLEISVILRSNKWKETANKNNNSGSRSETHVLYRIKNVQIHLCKYVRNFKMHIAHVNVSHHINKQFVFLSLPINEFANFCLLQLQRISVNPSIVIFFALSFVHLSVVVWMLSEC